MFNENNKVVAKMARSFVVYQNGKLIRNDYDEYNYDNQKNINEWKRDTLRNGKLIHIEKRLPMPIKSKKSKKIRKKSKKSKRI